MYLSLMLLFSINSSLGQIGRDSLLCQSIPRLRFLCLNLPAHFHDSPNISLCSFFSHWILIVNFLFSERWYFTALRIFAVSHSFNSERVDICVGIRPDTSSIGVAPGISSVISNYSSHRLGPGLFVSSSVSF